MVSPGRFREVVRIERPERTRSSSGAEAITGWTLVDEIYAEVLAPTSLDRAHEIAGAGSAAHEVLLQFRVRIPVDVGGEDRIVWEDNAYGVEGFVPNPAKGEMLITGRYVSGTDGR